MSDTLKQLETGLNYHFSNRELLNQALSHRSSGAINNERLEFLGDSVLNTVISTLLFERHPQFNEGALTRLRASLVNQATLAAVARELALGEYLSLGPGELKSGGQRRASILADALEAVLGAVYIDGGFKRLQTVVSRLFNTRLSVPVLNETLKDSKTQLQEALQAHDLPLPVYSVESITGQAHQQTFQVICRVEALGIHAYGKAASRRAAEQQAAQRVLEQWPDD